MSIMNARKIINMQLGAIDALEKSFNDGQTLPAEAYIGILLIIRSKLGEVDVALADAVGLKDL